ncbi:helix-turn-helix transcriptional regulator [Lacihabitans lacunae]|jgi:putative transcriptional regulator|uniref:Helix-turn-helix transcriptional regulator n=1 Tax=Lacihabitans lacunae TaxID=1028214 RepID=A0ABV7YZ26_9BACT
MKNLIRVERARLEISQTDLAERIGVSRQTIYAIENNKFTPSVMLAFKLAKELKVDINYLFELEDTD